MRGVETGDRPQKIILNDDSYSKIQTRVKKNDVFRSFGMLIDEDSKMGCLTQRE